MIQPESRLDFEPIGAALAAVHPSLRNYQEKHAPGEFLIRQKSSGYFYRSQKTAIFDLLYARITFRVTSKTKNNPEKWLYRGTLLGE